MATKQKYFLLVYRTRTFGLMFTQQNINTKLVTQSTRLRQYLGIESIANYRVFLAREENNLNKPALSDSPFDKILEIIKESD